MLEMVHYILRFIITMKHVISGAILSAARGPGERCNLPQRGLFHSPWLFAYFYEKEIFPLTFPDHSNSPTFSSFP